MMQALWWSEKPCQIRSVDRERCNSCFHAEAGKQRGSIPQAFNSNLLGSVDYIQVLMVARTMLGRVECALQGVICFNLLVPSPPGNSLALHSIKLISQEDLALGRFWLKAEIRQTRVYICQGKDYFYTMWSDSLPVSVGWISSCSPFDRRLPAWRLLWDCITARENWVENWIFMIESL